MSLTIYLFAVWGIFRGGIRNGYRYLLLGTLLYILIITAMGTGAMPGVSDASRMYFCLGGLGALKNDHTVKSVSRIASEIASELLNG